MLLSRLENPVALDDGLRHFAMGQSIANQGIEAADWSRFFFAGYFSNHPIDPWFLSDVLYAPLASLGVFTALRIVSLSGVFLLLLSFLFAARKWKASPTVTCTCIALLLFFEPSFFYRLLVGRPYVWMTPLSVLVSVSVLWRQYWLLVVSLTIAFLLSHLFVFPLLLALVGVLWLLSLRDWKAVSWLCIAIATGLLLGFFLHPDGGAYVAYLVDVFLRVPFLTGLEFGTEMQSGFSMGFRVLVMLAVLALLHAGYFKSGMSIRQYHRTGLSFLLLVNLIFLLLFLRYSRSIDFLWPLLLLSFLVLLSERPEALTVAVDRLVPPSLRIHPVLPPLITLLLCASVFAGVQGALYSSDETRSLRTYQNALADLPAGSRVLNVDWHFFMPAVLVRPDLKYATGIDPSFTSLDNPNVQRLLTEIRTDAWRNEKTAVEARQWMSALLAEYPSDFLVFFQKRHADWTSFLAEELHLPVHAINETVIVFDVRGL